MSAAAVHRACSACADDALAVLAGLADEQRDERVRGRDEVPAFLVDAAWRALLGDVAVAR